MSSAYKLYYFGLRARAEPIRVLLHYIQKPYEEVTFGFEEWPEYKTKMPLKQVPVLEVRQEEDGPTLKLSQTTAILRYLAKVHDVEANKVEEQALCDMYGEQIQDYIGKVREWTWTFIGMRPVEKRDELYESTVVPVVEELGKIFGQQLKKNGNGYFVGSKITWFDIFLAEFVDKIIGHATPDVFAAYPEIEEHHKKIFSLPTISKYIKERPSYPY
jgi:glutathione S-transferase